MGSLSIIVDLKRFDIRAVGNILLMMGRVNRVDFREDGRKERCMDDVFRRCPVARRIWQFYLGRSS